MKWVVVILLGVFFVSLGSAVVPTDCDSSMISYWQFEDTLVDEVGGNNGTWVGDFRYQEPFVVDKAVWLEGSSSITVSDNDEMFDASFSVEMWISKTGFSPDVDATLLEMGDYKIEFTSGNNIRASVGAVLVSSGILSDNTNYHIAFVWDLSDLKLYINGAEADSAALGSAANTGSAGLIIGDGFVGLMDELAIYDEALSADIIGTHYILGDDYCPSTGGASSESGESSTQTDYTLQGCTFDVGGGTFGVKKGECSGVDHLGEFFCSDVKQPFWTNESGLGCAMGDVDYRANSGNPNYCCPPTYFCNDSLAKAGEGLFKCNRRTVICEILSEDDCEDSDQGCIWIDFADECVSNLYDKDCGYYDQGSGSEAVKENACSDDIYSLGTKGTGTELCGKTITCNDGEVFSIPGDGCSCEWFSDLPEGDRCRLNIIATEMFNTTPEKDIFSCSYSYDLGDCIDGKQAVNWFSNSTMDSVGSGFLGFTGVPDDCLAALGCVSKNTERFCGSDLIRLPGFGLFALFASLFIVGIYYIKKS